MARISESEIERLKEAVPVARLDQGVPISGISTVNRPQAAMLAALNVKTPSPDPN